MTTKGKPVQKTGNKKTKNVFIGSVRAQKGNSKEYYLRNSVDLIAILEDGEELRIPAGSFINLQSPKDHLEFLVNNNHMTPEEANQKFQNTSKEYKYRVTVSRKSLEKSASATNQRAEKPDSDEFF